MRVLVAALPASGHLYPLMPLAVALHASGEDVVLATGDPLASAMRAAGRRVEGVPCDVAGGRRELIRTRPQLAELPPAERWHLGNALFAEVLRRRLLLQRGWARCLSETSTITSARSRPIVPDLS